ncbi:RMD1 family protein [Flavihumibacter solisilvae]|uniref:DUF155 domain-containing protein n=1 Tax=Flavihumibacter solisilvae TaxID=1349421 RepID=A0A0C1IGG2_9BACT|nr:RMD1 family protein [Flavihumibacter solisilvae]KIC93290.1 hypothetical protein OI18_18760 [Flavihumibacter solisilvae]
MFKVHAYQLADSIDIRQFRTAFTAELFHSDADELFFKIDTDKFIYVFKYGVVSFLNHSEIEMSAFIQLISPFCRHILPVRLSDEFDIDTNAGRLHFGFDKVSIPKRDVEMLRLIMLHVSQSVALDHFESLTGLLMEEANRHTQSLEVRGRLELSGIRIKRYIGKALNLKNRIAENLYIFDSPEETWVDEELNTLDLGLKRTFDLQSRFRTIEKRLGILKENLDLFKDLLQYRNSVVLEWIIILLIFVEVINLFVEKIMAR